MSYFPISPRAALTAVAPCAPRSRDREAARPAVRIAWLLNKYFTRPCLCASHTGSTSTVAFYEARPTFVQCRVVRAANEAAAALGACANMFSLLATLRRSGPYPGLASSRPHSGARDHFISQMGFQADGCWRSL